jgi:hypothetical protein
LVTSSSGELEVLGSSAPGTKTFFASSEFRTTQQHSSSLNSTAAEATQSRTTTNFAELANTEFKQQQTLQIHNS